MPAVAGAQELISYHRWGGMAGVSQHLTVFEDGRAELSDRKTGKRSEVQASDAELANLTAVIDAVPADRWHGVAGAIARRMLPRPHEAMRFQIRRSSKRIGGAAGSIDTDLAPLLSQLDELLARAVRESRD